MMYLVLWLYAEAVVSFLRLASGNCAAIQYGVDLAKLAYGSFEVSDLCDGMF